MWIAASRGIRGGGRPINLDCVSMIVDAKVDEDHWGLFVHFPAKDIEPALLEMFLYNKETHDYARRQAEVDFRINRIMTAITNGTTFLDLDTVE